MNADTLQAMTRPELQRLARVSELASLCYMVSDTVHKGSPCQSQPQEH